MAGGQRTGPCYFLTPKHTGASGAQPPSQPQLAPAPQRGIKYRRRRLLINCSQQFTLFPSKLNSPILKIQPLFSQNPIFIFFLEMYQRYIKDVSKMYYFFFSQLFFFRSKIFSFLSGLSFFFKTSQNLTFKISLSSLKHHNVKKNQHHNVFQNLMFFFFPHCSFFSLRDLFFFQNLSLFFSWKNLPLLDLTGVRKRSLLKKLTSIP